MWILTFMEIRHDEIYIIILPVSISFVVSKRGIRTNEKALSGRAPDRAGHRGGGSAGRRSAESSLYQKAASASN